MFVAGAEGTGHHFITALMMRLPSCISLVTTLLEGLRRGLSGFRPNTYV